MTTTSATKSMPGEWHVVAGSSALSGDAPGSTPPSDHRESFAALVMMVRRAHEIADDS